MNDPPLHIAWNARRTPLRFYERWVWTAEGVYHLEREPLAMYVGPQDGGDLYELHPPYLDLWGQEHAWVVTRWNFGGSILEVFALAAPRTGLLLWTHPFEPQSDTVRTTFQQKGYTVVP